MRQSPAGRLTSRGSRTANREGQQPVGIRTIAATAILTLLAVCATTSPSPDDSAAPAQRETQQQDGRGVPRVGTRRVTARRHIAVASGAPVLSTVKSECTFS